MSGEACFCPSRSRCGTLLEKSDVRKARRSERRKSPGDNLAIFHEFTREVRGRVGREPDDSRGTFANGAGGVLAAHLGPHPAGQTLFTAHFGRAAASWAVTPFNAVLETQ